MWVSNLCHTGMCIVLVSRVTLPRVLFRCHLHVAALPGLSTLAQLSTKPSAFILSATAVLGGSQLLCRRTRAISSQPASV